MTGDSTAGKMTLPTTPSAVGVCAFGVAGTVELVHGRSGARRRGRMGCTTGTHREREDKFDVESRFALPELSALLSEGGHIVRQWVDLHSTYCDTDDQRLLVGQMTLRRREGDTDTGWQLKLPNGRARTSSSP